MMSASVNFCPTITTLSPLPPQPAAKSNGRVTRTMSARRTSEWCMSPPSVSRRVRCACPASQGLELARSTLATPRRERVHQFLHERQPELEDERHHRHDQRPRDDLGGLEAVVAMDDDP